jgi:acetaldehyde dehydrogenase
MTNERNINMITCGGQASIPIAYAIGKSQKNLQYIEVVSSIASRSAGPATRLNLDEYVDTTEQGIKFFSKVNQAKAILNLNPAEPCIDMQTTIFAKVDNPDMPALKKEVDMIVTRIQSYVPGYSLLVNPIYENGRIVVMVKAQGLGDYLPKYAGNLDIINCAAIAVAEKISKVKNKIFSHD